MSEEVQADVETSEVQAGASEQPQETTQERPDWLPEKFDRPEELANSYSELERAFYSRKEDLRNQIVSELNDQAVKDAPISPADYELNFEAPDGMEYQINDEDPMLDWFRQTAHNYGLSQKEFDGLMNEYVQIDAMRGPDWNVEVLGWVQATSEEFLDTEIQDTYKCLGSLSQLEDLVKEIN